MTLPDARAELAACIGNGARIHRARTRGEAYAIPAGCAAREALASLGWRVREDRNLWLLIPTDAMLSRFEAQAVPEQLGFFARSLTPLRARPFDVSAHALFAEGLKLREASSPAAREAYEARVRNLAAVNLRSGTGGALACALTLPDADPPL